jgi:glycopeptide antibiotics resistance protein
MISITLFYSLQESKGEFEEYSELNDIDWSAFPISEEFGAWIPIALIFIVFFGFRFLAKTIERN